MKQPRMGPARHSQQDALSPLQELAAGRVDEDAVLFQGGAPCLGQATGPGAAAVTADAVAVPAGRVGRVIPSLSQVLIKGILNTDTFAEQFQYFMYET